MNLYKIPLFTFPGFKSGTLSSFILILSTIKDITV